MDWQIWIKILGETTMGKKEGIWTNWGEKVQNELGPSGETRLQRKRLTDKVAWGTTGVTRLHEENVKQQGYMRKKYHLMTKVAWGKVEWQGFMRKNMGNKVLRGTTGVPWLHDEKIGWHGCMRKMWVTKLYEDKLGDKDKSCLTSLHEEWVGWQGSMRNEWDDKASLINDCQPQAKAKAKAMPGRLYIHTINK